MADGERPGGHGRDGGSTPTATLRVVRGSGVRRSRARGPTEPGEVAARLSALERRVEEALAESGLGPRADHETIRALVDGAFGAVAGVRRWTVADAVASVRDTAVQIASVDVGAVQDLLLLGAYHYWWRVQASGLERVPREGRVLLVVNRSGALVPWEALMVGMTLTERPVRGDVRLLVDDWTAPRSLLAAALARAGVQRAGSPAARRLLTAEQAVVVFPEGRLALAKSYRHRYRLASFGGGGFARLAIETGAPIVPVAVIGAEETHPVLGRLDRLGQMLGLPTVPLTATFPWLGLAGLLPLPTKLTIHVGEPLDVAARHAPRDAARTEAVRRVRDQTRERLQALVTEGRRQRASIFRA